MIFNLKANAKINLSLDVVSKREDGYHNLESVMHTVPDLYDELTVSENDSGQLNIISNKELCPPEKNIIYKVYVAFYRKTGIKPQGFTVCLKKNIPDKAGLAGGSADGAEFLKFLNRYHSFPLNESELTELGAGTGADIPFLIKGGCCLCEGIGEILTPLPVLKNVNILIVKPVVSGLSTPEIFKALKLSEISDRPDTAKVIEAIRNGDNKKLALNMRNVLEEVSVNHCPVIKVLENILLSSGALCAMMSGSGNSVFGIFESETTSAVKTLRETGMELFISESRL